MAITPTRSLEQDYEQITHACGLLDRSERGKLALTGFDAADFLNGQVTNDILGLHPGQGCYAAFLTHKGKMLGDLRVLTTVGEDGVPELSLDTERVALQALFDMIRRSKVGHRVELHKRTLQRSLLSLVGPAARRVAGGAAACAAGGSDPGAPAPSESTLALALHEHANADARIAGEPVLLISTDVGVDVLCDAEATSAVSDALRGAGAQPVHQDAVEALRVEHGRPRYGVDVDDSTIPQEAGLNDRAVSFTKGCYVGQETVARLFYRGRPNRQLRGLMLSAPASSGAELHLGERVVGRLGSSVVSPRLGPVALALVRREVAVGDELSVDGISAHVAALPLG